MNANFSPSTATARRSPWPHLLVWLPTLLLIVLWSLFAWAAHALAGWSGWTAWAGGEIDPETMARRRPAGLSREQRRRLARMQRAA